MQEEEEEEGSERVVEVEVEGLGAGAEMAGPVALLPLQSVAVVGDTLTPIVGVRLTLMQESAA